MKTYILKNILPGVQEKKLAGSRYGDMGRVGLNHDKVSMVVLGRKSLFDIEHKDNQSPKINQFLKLVESKYSQSHSEKHRYTVASCSGLGGHYREHYIPLDARGRWSHMELSGPGVYKEGAHFEAAYYRRFEAGYCNWFCGYAFGGSIQTSIKGRKQTFTEFKLKTLTPIQLGVSVGPVIDAQDFDKGLTSSIFIAVERQFVHRSRQSLGVYHRFFWDKNANYQYREIGITYRFPVVFAGMILFLAAFGGPG